MTHYVLLRHEVLSNKFLVFFHLLGDQRYLTLLLGLEELARLLHVLEALFDLVSLCHMAVVFVYESPVVVFDLAHLIL